MCGMPIGTRNTIYRMVPFPITLNDPNPYFKATPLVDVEYISEIAEDIGIIIIETSALKSTVSFRMMLSYFE